MSSLTSLFSRHPASIRARLLLLLLAVVLPVSGVVAVFIVHEADEARETAYAQVKFIADGIATNLDSMLSDHEALLSTVAAEFGGDPPTRARRFDPDQFMRVHPQIVNLGVGDLRANNIYAYRPIQIPADEARKLPWVEQALASNSFLAGGAFQGRLSGRWVTVLTYPVRGENVKRSGFVSLALDLSALNERVFRSVPRSAIVSVLDSNDRFLLRSADSESWIGKLLPSANADFIRGKSAGVFSAPDLHGTPRLYAVTTVPRAGWRVLAGLPEDEVLAPARALLRRSIAIGGVVLVLVLALAWWLADGIARPIRALAETAGDIARGDTTARARIAGPIEVAEVARQFNHMLDSADQSRLALSRHVEDLKLAEMKLGESEAFYRGLFENMSEGVAHCRMIFENDVARDFVYLKVNSAFEQLTGLKGVSGRRVTEIIPGIREANPDVFEIYGQVVSNGKPQIFETYLPGLKIWFSVSVYRPEKGEFIAVFDNITKRKQSEMEIDKRIKELQRWYEVTLNREGRVQELKTEVNGLRQRLGEPLRYTGTGQESEAGLAVRK